MELAEQLARDPGQAAGSDDGRLAAVTDALVEICSQVRRRRWRRKASLGGEACLIPIT